MATKHQEKREKLRTDLLESATQRIQSGGLAKLRARDLAQDVGCALGALYHVFGSIDDLIWHVNLKTLQLLREALRQASQQTAHQQPAEQMVFFAHAYLDFALTHTHLWRALFEHQMPEGYQVPDWYLEAQAVLFQDISRPLQALKPDLDSQRAAWMARGLFSAVHGVVSLGLEQRFAAVPEPEIRTMLTGLIGSFAKSPQLWTEHR